MEFVEADQHKAKLLELSDIRSRYDYLDDDDVLTIARRFRTIFSLRKIHC
jgi:hypothetical protein